ncbi:MAG: putative glycolipid-binding domain-containing protein [Acidobacteria bacterium]|nr:putative glycolipid-binding domain-containing protein [Acidobacteriota bacterium]
MRTVVWTRIDGMGMELATLSPATASAHTMEGTVIVVSDATPFVIRYGVELDEGWQTRRVQINGSRAAETFQIELVAEESVWRRNGEALPQFDGCVDIDLGFSPSTNTLPIRRCAASVGERIDVTAVWLRFPELTLERLDQSYERISERSYLYRSATGFETTIEVDDHGLVLNYPQGWKALAT